MPLERPDRPRVVAVERRDSEGSAVLDHEVDESGEAGEIDPGRTSPSRPVSAAELPHRDRDGHRGESQQSGPTEAHVNESQLGREDAHEHESAEVREPAARDKLSPGARDAQERQHAEARRGHEGVRAEQVGHSHRKR